MKEIDILLVEPGKAPRTERVGGTEEAFSATLNGPVDFGCYLPQRVIMVRREDKANLPPNRVDPSTGEMIAGTFLLCGFDEDRFISLTPVQQALFQNYFS